MSTNGGSDELLFPLGLNVLALLPPPQGTWLAPFSDSNLPIGVGVWLWVWDEGQGGGEGGPREQTGQNLNPPLPLRFFLSHVRRWSFEARLPLLMHGAGLSKSLAYCVRHCIPQLVQELRQNSDPSACSAPPPVSFLHPSGSSAPRNARGSPSLNQSENLVKTPLGPSQSFGIHEVPKKHHLVDVVWWNVSLEACMHLPCDPRH